MLDFLKTIFGPNVSPMNTIHIRKSSILHNLEYLQSLQPTSAVFPVLKSNAYGHGLKQMVKILRNVDVPYVVVDSYPEYQIVKKYSDHHILVL
jgi:alanine racemase